MLEAIVGLWTEILSKVNFQIVKGWFGKVFRLWSVKVWSWTQLAWGVVGGLGSPVNMLRMKLGMDHIVFPAVHSFHQTNCFFDCCYFGSFNGLCHVFILLTWLTNINRFRVTVTVRLSQRFKILYLIDMSIQVPCVRMCISSLTVSWLGLLYNYTYK